MKGMDHASAVMRRISTLDRAEVYEQARGLACRSEEASALREMHVAQRTDDLEFDDDLVLDRQVGGKFANDNVVVKDDYSPLLDGAEPALSHFVGEGVVHLFNEPMTERTPSPARSINVPALRGYGRRLLAPSPNSVGTRHRVFCKQSKSLPPGLRQVVPATNKRNAPHVGKVNSLRHPLHMLFFGQVVYGHRDFTNR